jgi:predicted RNA-binding protein with PUA-like domain
VARWLLKTEPSTYSFDDLAREKTTVWNGITNAAALIHMRSMKKGDAVLVYHTGDERAVAGIATIASAPFPDPDAGNEKIVAVKVKAGKRLKNAVPLSTIKDDATFKDWELLRIGRLSVVPVPDRIWERVIELSNQSEGSRT